MLLSTFFPSCRGLAPAIAEALAAYQQQLQTYANLLEQQDWQGLSDAFTRAKRTRDALLPS